MDRCIRKYVSREAQVLVRPNHRAIVKVFKLHADASESLVQLVQALAGVRVEGLATERIHKVRPVPGETQSGANFTGSQNELKEESYIS